MGQSASLVVVDDFFPSLQTGFRVAEYNHYLRVLPNVIIACSTGDFAARHAEYARFYPEHAHRVVPLRQVHLASHDLAYVNFLNNAAQFLPLIEKAELPFVFSLYPGGGFDLNSSVTDEKLSGVLSSPLLRAVISTQPITTWRLRERRCPAPIHDIFGVTVNPVYLSHGPTRADRDHSGDAIRICFAAYKYSAQGATKGYPEFIEVAQRLAAGLPRTRFTVVGNFGPDDVPLSEDLRSRLVFAGVLPTLALRDLFCHQDIIISPNRAFGVTGSVFDGFPTASTVEAMLCGVAAICSDELGLNRHYTPDRDLVICRPEVDAVLSAAMRLIRDPCALRGIARMGQRRSRALFSAERQLLPRTRLLRRVAGEVGSAV